jgi:hypothetical protein
MYLQAVIGCLPVAIVRQPTIVAVAVAVGDCQLPSMLSGTATCTFRNYWLKWHFAHTDFYTVHIVGGRFVI